VARSAAVTDEDSIVQTKHFASALLAVLACAPLAASCVQHPETPPIDSPPLETKDDDGDFGGDPDVGGSIGGDPDVGGSIGGDPVYSWSPPSGTPTDGDVSDSDPDTNTGDDSSSIASPPADRQGLVVDVVNCYKFEYGSDCLQRCRDAGHRVTACTATRAHPKNAHGGMGLLNGCSWTFGIPSTCSYVYPSSSEMCTFYFPIVRSSCEWSR
jgi:hypothetical protein